MERVITIILCFVFAFAKGQVYNPSLHTVSNDAIGFGQATPADGRTMFWDAGNFRWRDFQSTAEALTVLPSFANRFGHSFISIHAGGALQSNGTWLGGVSNLYWFRNGTADSNLVQMPTDIVSTAGFFQVTNNLSEGVPSTMRTNLGLGTMSTQNIAAGGTNLSGNWPDPTVILFNSQPASFYLNYLNLSNRPAQLNPTAAGLDSISGVFPNLTWTGRTPGWEQTLFKNNTLSKNDSLNMGSFTFNFLGTGAIVLPAGTTAQRPSPAIAGMYRFNLDSLKGEKYTGAAWVSDGSGGGGGGGGITALTGDGTASGTGSVPFTLATVNTNVFGSNTFLKFAVNGKGLIPSATAVVSGDITGALGFTPYNATNPIGYIPLTALSNTVPIGYNNSTGVISLDTTTLNGGWHSRNYYDARYLTGNQSITLSGDVAGTGTTAITTTIQTNAVTTSKINNAAVTYAKIQNTSGSSVLLGAQTAGTIVEVTLGTNLSMIGGVLNATTAGAQTLTYTQNATNNNLAISGGNSVNFLIATATKAGLIDSAHYHYLDSLFLGLKTFGITTLNGISQTGGDTLLFGGSLIQNTTLATAGFDLLFTGLPHKAVGGTDSLFLSDASGKIWKTPVITGGITQLTGDVTAGPGSGSQAATIAALAVTTGKIAANAVTLGKMSTNASNTLLGYDGSGNPVDVTAGTGISISSGIISGTAAQTWQNTLTTGSTLNTNNTITNTGQTLTWTGGTYKYNGLLTGTGTPTIIVHEPDSSIAQFALGTGIYASAGSLSTHLFTSSVQGEVPSYGTALSRSQIMANGTWGDYDEQAIGTLYAKNSWANLNDWSNTSGSSATITSNQIVFSGDATGVFTHYLSDSAYGPSALDQFTIYNKFKVGSYSSTATDFLGIGKVSTNAYNSTGIAGVMFINSGANAGKIAIYASPAPGFTQVAISTSVLSFSVNDIILQSLTRNGFTVTLTVQNYTTKAAPLSLSYTYVTTFGTTTFLDNTGRYSVFAGGSPFTVDSFAVASTTPTHARMMMLGDSKTQGYYATAQSNRFTDLCNLNLRSSYVNGGQADRLTEISSRMKELLLLAPQQVTMLAGSNDIRSGLDSVSMDNRYDSIVTAFRAAGDSVYHAPLWETSISILPLYRHILATYPANRIIDTYTAMQLQPGVLQPDNIHLTDLGNQVVANTILAFPTLNFINTRYAGGSSPAAGANGDLQISNGTLVIASDNAKFLSNTLNIQGNIQVGNSGGGVGSDFLLTNAKNSATVCQATFQPATGTNVTQQFSIAPIGTGSASGQGLLEVFNTPYASSNPEILQIGAFGANGYTIGAIKGGSGSFRKLVMSASAVSNQLVFSTNGTLLCNTGTDNGGNFQIGANTSSTAMMFFNGAAVDVTSPSNGMFWYNSTAHTLNFRDNGVTTNLLAGGGFTNPMTTTGDIIYSSSGSTPARLGIGSTGQVLTVASGIPSWGSPSPVTKAKNDQTGFSPGGSVIVNTFTPPADGTYRVGGYVTVTAVSVDVIKVQVTWTDETNTSRTQDLTPIGAGSVSIATTGAFIFPTVDIRAKSGTVINFQTLTTTGTGTMTFDAGGNIQFLQ